MSQTISEFLDVLTHQPKSIEFSEVIALIDAQYDFTETAFSNGAQHNEAGQNSGSCKVLSFAQLHGLTQQQTLNLFAQYYRDDVLQNPDADDHQNIRQFMQQGFAGLNFDAQALSPKL